MNISMPVATQEEAEAGLSSDKLMTPERTAQALAALGVGGSSSVIDKLTADRSYYVAATGNDLTGTGAQASPWATVQKAYEYAQENLFFCAHTVTVYVMTNITENCHLSGRLTGTRAPENFLIRGLASDRSVMWTGNISLANGAECRLRYLTMQPAAGNSWTVTDGVLQFGDLNLNIFGGGPISNAAGPRAKVQGVGPCTLVGVGACNIVFISEDHAQHELGCHIDFAGAPTWNNAFCQGDLGGMIDGTGFSYGGSGYPTGKRFNSNSDGIVFTGLQPGDPAAATFFPGSLPGSATGGFYQ